MDERFEVEEVFDGDFEGYAVIDLDAALDERVVCIATEMEAAERIAELLNEHGIEPETE